MKKTLLRKAAMASLFTLMTLTVTKANAKELSFMEKQTTV